MKARRRKTSKPMLRVVGAGGLEHRLSMPIIERLEIFQKELMTAAERGEVIEHMREIAAEIATVIRIELLLIANRKTNARIGSSDTGSEARKYTDAFEEESGRRGGDRHRPGTRPGAAADGDRAPDDDELGAEDPDAAA